MSNPFFYGGSIPPEHFVGRENEIRRLINPIITGQSTAIIGEPRSGKTSLLRYLAEPTLHKKHYDKHGEKLLFSFLDVQTLSDQFNQSQFWEHALRPLHENIITSRSPNTLVAKAYKNCQKEDFSVFALERLFEKMQQDGQHLVFMIDEFDALLNHPTLNKATFFGSLRSLTSRTQALSLLIASRLSLSNLNSHTQQFTTGSPYFNVFQDNTLGPLADTAVQTLLNRGNAHFNEDDHHFITKVAGAHPYLLQAAASALWETYEDGESESQQRHILAGQQLYETAKLTFYDTWRLWEPMTRMVVMTIALNQWNKPGLLRDMSSFKQELRGLEKQGFILRETDYQKRWQHILQRIVRNNSSGYMIYPEVLLWWLANELSHAVRDEQSFNDWTRRQELDGILTQEQKQQLNQAGQSIAHSLVAAGIFEFIKTAIGLLG
ncbi:MAG: ATP-binding protein [Candidatus Parabeggiatoa sp.]|nr:ATP-binding protein [Candidatus Parabeggiatoa sp.]